MAVIDQHERDTKANVDAIWNEAREAVRGESYVVRKRVLESYLHNSPEDPE